MQYVFLALIAALVSAATIITYKLITKHFFRGIDWLYPVSPALGYIYMYFFTTATQFHINLKNMLLFAFIVSMILVNFRCVILGTKRTVESGKNFSNEFKKLKGEKKKKNAVADSQNGTEQREEGADKN